jgi:hypothetical protein
MSNSKSNKIEKIPGKFIKSRTESWKAYHREMGRRRSDEKSGMKDGNKVRQ